MTATIGIGHLLMPESWLERGVEYLKQVDGDCMDPCIHHCDFVGIRPQSTANDGDIVIAEVPGFHPMLKRYRRIDGDTWLVPDNSAYEPIPADDAEILGVVVGIMHWRD